MASSASANCLNNKSGERLTNFCLLERTKGSVVSLEFAQFFDYRLKQSGYSNGAGLPGKAKPTTVSYQAAPVVYYSSNINGGNPNKKLILGEWDFSGDPKLVLKKGMLLGATTGLTSRSIYAEGKFLDLNLSTSYAHSLKYNIGVLNLAGGICSKNHIKHFWHIDLCANSSRTLKKIVNDQNRNISLDITKLFSSMPGSHHEAAVSLNRNLFPNYQQNQLGFRLETVTPSGILSNIKMTFGEKIGNNVALKNSLDWSLSKAWGKKILSLSGSFTKSWDGKIFGQLREEGSRSINMYYGLGNGINVGVGIASTDSNIDYFRSTNPSFYINFTSLKF
jgi:hypothetical protein|tara:strand:- start:108 stop:1112 length:1005 start_codon:yes stop_codon:yes gene_type:complete